MQELYIKIFKKIDSLLNILQNWFCNSASGEFCVAEEDGPDHDVTFTTDQSLIYNTHNDDIRRWFCHIQTSACT